MVPSAALGSHKAYLGLCSSPAPVSCCLASLRAAGCPQPCHFVLFCWAGRPPLCPAKVCSSCKATPDTNGDENLICFSLAGRTLWGICILRAFQPSLSKDPGKDLVLGHSLWRLRETWEMWKSWSPEAQREPGSPVIINDQGCFGASGLRTSYPELLVPVVHGCGLRLCWQKN